MKKPKHVVTDRDIEQAREWAKQDRELAKQDQKPLRPVTYDELVAQLAKAVQLPAGGAPAQQYWRVIRTRHFTALNMIGNYLCSNGAKDVGNWFFTLAIDLNDLDYGIVPPLLSPVRVENRAGDPTITWIRRAWVALGIEALLVAKFSRKEAARMAVGHENIRHFIGPTNTAPDKVALSWRDEFSKGRVKNLSAAGTYGACCAQISEWTSESGFTKTSIIELAEHYFSHV